MCNVKNSLLLIPILVVAALFPPMNSLGGDSGVSRHLTRSGKSLLIEERHPVGQSLSDIFIRSEGFDHNISEVFDNRDPIHSVHVADLDENGFDEFYIITISTGSGSYGNLIAFASNRDKSLSMIHFPEIRQEDERFTGYMGHDAFSIEGNKLIRSFPVYLPTDTNNNPTGGTRQLAYGLFPGEAMWQLKVINE
jgi:hypothetical protein